MSTRNTIRAEFAAIIPPELSVNDVFVFLEDYSRYRRLFTKAYPNAKCIEVSKACANDTQDSHSDDDMDSKKPLNDDVVKAKGSVESCENGRNDCDATTYVHGLVPMMDCVCVKLLRVLSRRKPQYLKDDEAFKEYIFCRLSVASQMQWSWIMLSLILS